MKQKNLPKPKGLLIALFAFFYVFSVHAEVIPYLPSLQSFGGSEADLSTFLPIEENFTLEVQGSVGTPISICGGVITYTPTTSGTVRFSQSNGMVYIYEGSTYIKLHRHIPLLILQ